MWHAVWMRTQVVMGLPPVIRMIRQQTRCAIQLLGDHQPHQHMRQGERAERPVFVRGGQYIRCVAFGGLGVNHDSIPG